MPETSDEELEEVPKQQTIESMESSRIIDIKKAPSLRPYKNMPIYHNLESSEMISRAQAEL